MIRFAETGDIPLILELLGYAMCQLRQVKESQLLTPAMTGPFAFTRNAG
ncbi:MAG: hypothetical protein K6F21_03930 [Bacteroidales bacterium]|nr:hypothetical protein [Bacteroidales bacterium]